MLAVSVQQGSVLCLGRGGGSLWHGAGYAVAGIAWELACGGGGGVVGECTYGHIGAQESRRGHLGWGGCGKIVAVRLPGLARGAGGGPLWLVPGVVEEDLSVPVPRIEADGVPPSGMWLMLRLVLLRPWLDAGLISGPVRALLLRGQVSRCLRLGLGLGAEWAADACH